MRQQFNNSNNHGVPSAMASGPEIKPLSGVLGSTSSNCHGLAKQVTQELLCMIMCIGAAALLRLMGFTVPYAAHMLCHATTGCGMRSCTVMG